MADDRRGFAALSGNLRGAIWMVMGGTSLTLMAVTIREIQDTYSVPQMIFMRSVVSFFLILPWVIRAGAVRLRTQRAGLHVFRNVIHYLGNLGWFLGVTLVPLADLSALQFTVPLFTIVLAALVLRETVGPHRWTATAIGFVGALVVIRPGFIQIEVGTMAVILSALFYAASQVSTKSLSRTDSPTVILFYMTVVFIPVSAVPAAFDWVTPAWADMAPIALLGVFGVLAHAFIIRAFAAADASFVMPFDFMRLPISAAFGFVLYLEQPDIWVWVGAAIIFGATWYITWREGRQRGEKAGT